MVCVLGTPCSYVLPPPHVYCRVPRSQRSGEIIEPLVSEQWFVRMEPLAKPALAAVADGTIRIMPERFERVYNNWLENIKVGCGGGPAVHGMGQGQGIAGGKGVVLHGGEGRL